MEKRGFTLSLFNRSTRSANIILENFIRYISNLNVQRESKISQTG